MYRMFMFLGMTGLVLAAFAGCDRGVKVAPADTTPTVPVSQPVQREVTDYVEYTGRTNAKDSVTIVPRVTGYVVTDEEVKDEKEKITWKEGDFVNKNQLLFRIDPRPYKAQLDAAEAAVAQNTAGLNYAIATNLLYKGIAKERPDAVSLRELDQYKAQEEQALANLKLAKANLESAKLNHQWTEVRAPIDGYASRYFLTPGNLVNQDVTQLTTIVSMDPMYVSFDMDEPTMLRMKKAVGEGKISPHTKNDQTGSGRLGDPARPGPEAPLLMALAGEEFDPKDKSRQGHINFIDNQFNPGTGSIPARGAFPNTKLASGSYLLAPGMFVRVRLPLGQPQQELLVIDRAVTSEQGLKYVYVVDNKNNVEARRVSVGALQEDGLRVITSGLKKEEWVLVGGLQQVRPKMTVQPERVSMPSLRDPATPAEDKSKEQIKQGKKK